MIRVTAASSHVPEPFRPVVVAPTYNHGGTLPALIRQVLALNLPIIVVNDGSTDQTQKALREAIDHHGLCESFVLHHPTNRGKAAALRTGFGHAASQGFTHALTIDTDGQHHPSDIPAMLALAQAHPHALILGERGDDLPDYPRASLIGRRLANMTIRLSCGLRISDSQCGLRVYPLDLVNGVVCRTGRYAFESEILTRATWAGWKVIGTPITSSYAPRDRRISHFRNLRDSLAGVLLQLRLLLRSCLPMRHRRTAPQENERKGG